MTTSQGSATAPNAAQGSTAASIADFARDLRELRLKAGAPSYRDLYRRSGGRLSPATLSRALSGQACPRWEVTAHFLMCCGVLGEDLQPWRERWASVFSVWKGYEPLRQSEDPTGEVPPTQQHECADCGAWIVNAARHQSWHESLELALLSSSPDSPSQKPGDGLLASRRSSRRTRGLLGGLR